jgi:nucleotide-binding universal stress UspA family protein
LATVHSPHPLVGSAGKALLERIERDRADYLVMGGYGHSRLRERLFGGVTRTLLSKSPIPLLLAHAPSV